MKNLLILSITLLAGLCLLYNCEREERKKAESDRDNALLLRDSVTYYKIKNKEVAAKPVVVFSPEIFAKLSEVQRAAEDLNLKVKRIEAVAGGTVTIIRQDTGIAVHEVYLKDTSKKQLVFESSDQWRYRKDVIRNDSIFRYEKNEVPVRAVLAQGKRKTKILFFRVGKREMLPVQVYSDNPYVHISGLDIVIKK